MIDFHSQAVTRLEFESIDPFEKNSQVVSDHSATGSRIALEEEVLALRDKLQTLTEHAAQREAEHSLEIANARRECEATKDAKIQRERRALAEAVDKFGGERNRYFGAIEAEVVKLALAIAARILHREATIDPMLLRGAVRVALDQVADDSSTLLRVPRDDWESWQEISVTASGAFPQVIADESLMPGECLLETKLGKVELGIAAQLQEIERGFFDLLQKRPA